MNGPTRKRLSHFVPSWLNEGAFYLITVNCVPRGLNQLCVPSIGPRMLASANYYHEERKWHVTVFLLMPDHLHAIISFPAEFGMKALIKAWKSYQTRSHKIQLQGDFFDHRLRDRSQYEEAHSYILHNPVRKGLCTRPEDWPYVFSPAAENTANLDT